MSVLSASMRSFCSFIRILVSPRQLLTDIFKVPPTSTITTTSAPAGNHHWRQAGGVLGGSAGWGGSGEGDVGGLAVIVQDRLQST